MKAILSNEPGPSETLILSETEAPTPNPYEVLIKVKAIGVNYFDALIIEDKYQFRPPRPFAPCSEISGTIDAIGEKVTGFAIGDRVLANISHGGMAEFACANFDKCFKIPDNMDFNSAAGFFITYGTSYHALKQRANLKTGETLLVLGAAGGVGLAAVELGVAMGAKVIAACSSQEKLDIAVSHGASCGIIYPIGPFDGAGKKALSAIFKEGCGANGADVIYDAIGGDYSEASFRSLAWNGRFLVVGFPSGIASIPLNLPLLKSGNIMGVFWGAFTERAKLENQENINELMDLYAKGKIKPLVSKVFDFENGAEAIKHLASRKAVGKIIVSVP